MKNRKERMRTMSTDYTPLNKSGLHAVILPVNADAITVSGLARYNFPGPERPWKLRLIAETVT